MDTHRHSPLDPSRVTRTAFGLLTYAGETPPAEPDFVIPEDLSSIDDEELATLHATAVGNFDTLYNGGEGLTNEALAALATLTEGIEAVNGELSARQAAAAERTAAATELATRVHHEERTETIDDSEAPDATDPEEDEEETGAGTPASTPEGQPVGVVAAASRREIRVNMGALARRGGQPALATPNANPQRVSDVMYSTGEGSGFPAGQGLDWNQVGQIVDRRLASFNLAQFENAAGRGVQLSQQHGVAVIRKPIPANMFITSNDPAHVNEVMDRATDESRLPGGSLVAAGGWCAPSEILYDLLELESRDGLFSMPEIGISRGGIQWTTGPDFTTIYGAIGFGYTEANDIAGTYAVDTSTTGDALHQGTGGAGSKPCYTVPCPTFVEARLQLAGLCINAGLLQQRGYPEVIARTVRGALVAHDHKMSVRKINALVAGSTAVTMTTGTVGSLAPLLTAIEQQTEHYKYIRRMARNITLEAVFPFWVRGAIRSDLALRQGVENFLDIPDSQIDAWFSSRGINAQYVYDWQPLTGAAGTMVAWPATVQFLLYAAGTWVGGTSDVITIDTLYDSALLGLNNYTALFTEEGWLVSKRGFDSRVITVPLCASGAVGAQIVLACDGSSTVAGGDLTGPVAGTSASSAITSTGFTLTVTGASDAGQGLHGLPYRFSIDGGSTWSAWQASNVNVRTGLVTVTAYQTRHQVRDVNGNISTGNALTVTTI